MNDLEKDSLENDTESLNLETEKAKVETAGEEAGPVLEAEGELAGVNSSLTKLGLIEGLIFASAHPLSERQIAEILDLPKDEVAPLLEEIEKIYADVTHGFHLVKVAGGYQFRTKSDLREIMARFNERKPPRLTQATLEVLSVIAYKQPVTRSQIEKIRGVDCSGVLKTLLERELIEMRGRSDLPGHPTVYGVTAKFLEWFQIRAIQDLPPLSEMEALNVKGIEQAGAENLLNLLNKDDGFTSESLSEVDATLNQITRQNAQLSSEFEVKAEKKEPEILTEDLVTEKNVLAAVDENSETLSAVE